MHKAFWLGLVGGIPGIIVSLMLIVGASLGEALGEEYLEYTGLLFTLGIIGTICSIVGMIGGALERQKLVGAFLLFGTAVVMFIFLTLVGAFTTIFFIIAGVLMLRDHLKERNAVPAVPYQYPQPYPGQPTPNPPQAQATLFSGQSQGAMLYCPRCGARTEEPDQRYCNACGKKLE